MRIALLGTSGQLGSAVLNLFEENDYNIIAVPKNFLSEENFPQLEDLLKFKNFDAVINMAADTKSSSGNFSHESNWINNTFVGKIAKVCAVKNIHLIHFSSDAVFDRLFWESSEGASTEHSLCPLSKYGFAKANADTAIIKSECQFSIVRVGWLFGSGDSNFVSKIVFNLKRNKFLPVVINECGFPTSTYFVAKIVKKILDDKLLGIFHIKQDQKFSRFSFAQLILKKIEKIGYLDTQPCSFYSFPRNNEGKVIYPLKNYSYNSNLIADKKSKNLISEFLAPDCFNEDLDTAITYLLDREHL